MAIKFNKNFNINRLVKRIMYLVVGLLVGGLILTAFVNAFVGYCSVLFNGLSIIGVNITNGLNSTGGQHTTTLQSGCGTSSYTIGMGSFNTGILTVVGVLGVAGIVMTEFVRW